MKILILSDTHFGIKQNSLTWMNSQLEFIRNEFIPCLKHYVKEDFVQVIHCGDVFDSRSSINPYIANKVREVFSDIARIAQTYIVAGNHDFYSPNDDSVSALDMVFNSIDNLSVIRNEITGVLNEDLDLHSLLVPWYEFENKDKLNEWIKQNNPKYIFCHTDLTRLSDEYKDVLKNVKVFSGHIHTPQKQDNLITLGSTFPLTFADCNSKRGFYVLDTNTDELLFVEGKKVIKFWRFYNEEIFNIDVEKLKNDYIELYINKLNLLNEKYTEQISLISSKVHNTTVVPNNDLELQTKQMEFSNYDIKEICESNIPDNLKNKFNEIIENINKTQ
jgi:DNA repair exonuclease SbcCD nuclease subunit